MTDAAPGNGAAREAASDRVVVVIPTLDEEQSIADVVRGIPRAIVSRVIVADGGSRDATAARAKAAGADVIDAGRGYGRACLAATMAAEDADIVVFMDGDGADDPGSIAKLVEPKRGESRAAHSGDSGRLSSATRRQFQGGGKYHRNHSGRRAHHRDLHPRYERDKSVAARARSSARAFERTMIKSESSGHRHNVICFVERFRLMLDR